MIENRRETPPCPDDRYPELWAVLMDAWEQATAGKGAERHGTDGRYEDQPTYWIGKQVGRGFQLGQALKKIIEAERLEERGDTEAANRERLGAIVYVAFGIIESRRPR
jgi:hypothetical protein